MFGAGNKRDDGISSTNIFAALDSRRRKSSKKDKKDSVSKPSLQNVAQFWAPTPVLGKSWADVDDDDDYFATSVPPPSAEGFNQAADIVTHGANETLSQAEENEAEEDVSDEADEDAEEEEQHGSGAAAAPDKVAEGPFLSPVVISKDPERQLSKKELKKKELDELDAVLKELGLAPKETEVNGSLAEEKLEMAMEEANDNVENKNEGPTLSESKSSRRRKAKKEKSFKEPKDGEDQVKYEEIQVKDGEGNQPVDVDSSRREEEHEEVEANAVTLDPKERLKKLSSLKKKKSSKDIDAAAKAAAAEAAARAAKLAIAKKREKNHYNQQPVR